MSDSSAPLFSVICFCKDRVSLIKRSIESVLNQTYANLEFVVQDGASTDGTLELLRSYAERDSRIKIVSEPDSGPAEAYWKVLHRCRGDYIATCLSDEELVPDALEKAVGWFTAQPTVGAFTCDGYTTDADGRITGDFKAGEFDFVAYLFGKYCPFWPGSFFRRQALIDIGLERPDWNIGCLEFEIWCRLARDHEVRYVPVPVSKYAVHPGQLSNTPANFYEHIDNRLKLIESMFALDGFFGAEKTRRVLEKVDQRYAFHGEDWFREIESKISQLSQFEFHARAHRLLEDEREFTRRIDALTNQLIELHEHDIRVEKLLGWYYKYARREIRRRELKRFWQAWEYMTGLPREPQLAERSLQRKVSLLRFLIEAWLIRRPHPLERALRLARQWGIKEDASPILKGFADTARSQRLAKAYDTTARIYESRGQIKQAIAMWRHAEPLNDRTVDSLACQAVLKESKATDRSIAELQQHWVDRHIVIEPAIQRPRFLPYDGRRKLRVGYHCAFMNADTIRFIMRGVFQAHDRSKFEIFGYSATDEPADGSFDILRKTRDLSDRAFVELVRSDRIDILVELTGFSPGHRFGAMANRCAPVQISYLNHFGTSRVPNVDYILSDAICTPPESRAQESYSEKIHLLKNCLLCYDYSDADCPEVGDLPCLTNQFITFGYLGTAGKLNSRMIELWSELMRRAPRSRLLVQNPQLDSASNRRFLADRFHRHGISADRLDLRPRTDRLGVLEAYGEIDISLDTWPYCGGNTVAESLWQGVPVVTLKGERFASRYGASLLQRAGCAELIADTAQQYVAIACGLARDPKRLEYFRSNLRRLCTEAGLNDSPGFARNLEQAYESMMRAWSESERHLPAAAAASTAEHLASQGVSL